MMHAFVVSSVVRGYHEYKDIWSAPIDGAELPCKREPGNPRDTSAVAVIERNPSGELTLSSGLWPLRHAQLLFSLLYTSVLA